MQGRAVSVLQKVNSFRHLLMFFLMLDILDELKTLSLLFQENGVTIPNLLDGLWRVEAALQAIIIRPGPNLRSFLSEVGEGNVCKGVALTRNDSDIQQFNERKQRVVGSVNNYITNRFQGFAEDSVLSATQIFDHKLWPGEQQKLAIYGAEQLDRLLEHFREILTRNHFDFDTVYQEGADLKVCVTSHHMDLNYEFLWKRMNTGYGKRFLNILMIVEIVLVMPVCTACCERGFSCLNRIKTDTRTRLEVKTVDSLMRILIDGPSLMTLMPKWLSGTGGIVERESKTTRTNGLAFVCCGTFRNDQCILTQ